MIRERHALLGALGLVVVTVSLLAGLLPGALEAPDAQEWHVAAAADRAALPAARMPESTGNAPAGSIRRVPVGLNVQRVDGQRGHGRCDEPAPLLARARVLDARDHERVTRFRAVLTPCEVAVADGSLAPAPEPPKHALAFVAPDGSFELAAERPGPQWLQVWPELALPVAALVLVTRDGSRDEHQLLVEPGVAGGGIVLDPEGAPVPHAWVSLQPVAPAETIGAASGEDGSFRLPPVVAGTYRIRVEAPGLPAWESGPLGLHLAEREPSWTLRLPRGATVWGTVRPWHPGQHADVVLTHASGIARRAAVGVDGRYELSRLTPGPYHVHLDHAGNARRNYVAEQMRDPGGPPDLILVDSQRTAFDVLDAAASLGRIQGRVLGHGAPGTLTITADREDMPLPAALAGLLQTAPEPAGAFAIDGLAPGRWRLEVRDSERRLLHRAVQMVAPFADLAVQLPLRR